MRRLQVACTPRGSLRTLCSKPGHCVQRAGRQTRTRAKGQEGCPAVLLDSSVDRADPIPPESGVSQNRLSSVSEELLRGSCYRTECAVVPNVEQILAGPCSRVLVEQCRRENAGRLPRASTRSLGHRCITNSAGPNFPTPMCGSCPWSTIRSADAPTYFTRLSRNSSLRSPSCSSESATTPRAGLYDQRSSDDSHASRGTVTTSLSTKSRTRSCTSDSASSTELISNSRLARTASAISERRRSDSSRVLTAGSSVYSRSAVESVSRLLGHRSKPASHERNPRSRAAAGSRSSSTSTTRVFPLDQSGRRGGSKGIQGFATTRETVTLLDGRLPAAGRPMSRPKEMGARWDGATARRRYGRRRRSPAALRAEREIRHQRSYPMRACAGGRRQRESTRHR